MKDGLRAPYDEAISAIRITAQEYMDKADFIGTIPDEQDTATFCRETAAFLRSAADLVIVFEKYPEFSALLGELGHQEQENQNG